MLMAGQPKELTPPIDGVLRALSAGVRGQCCTRALHATGGARCRPTRAPPLAGPVGRNSDCFSRYAQENHGSSAIPDGALLGSRVLADKMKGLLIPRRRHIFITVL